MSGCIRSPCPLSAHASHCCFPASHRCPLLRRQIHGSSGSPSVARAGPAPLSSPFGLRRPFLVPPRGSAAKSDQCGASLGAPALPAALTPPARGRPDGGLLPGLRCLCLARPWRLHVFFVSPDPPTASPLPCAPGPPFPFPPSGGSWGGGIRDGGPGPAGEWSLRGSGGERPEQGPAAGSSEGLLEGAGRCPRAPGSFRPLSASHGTSGPDTGVRQAK